MTDEKKYALVIATDFYMIHKNGSYEELEKITKTAIADGFYLHEIEDGTHRFIPLTHIRFFDIITEEKFKENMAAAQAAQQSQVQQAPPGRIIQLPPRGPNQ